LADLLGDAGRGEAAEITNTAATMIAGSLATPTRPVSNPAPGHASAKVSIAVARRAGAR
jgi:hypothetical protein